MAKTKKPPMPKRACPARSPKQVSRAEVDLVDSKMNKLDIRRKFVTMPTCEKHVILAFHLGLDTALKHSGEKGGDWSVVIKRNGDSISILTRTLKADGTPRMPSVSVEELEDTND